MDVGLINGAPQMPPPAAPRPMATPSVPQPLPAAAPATSSQYRFMDALNIKRIDSPDQAEGEGYSETWPVGEEGTPERPRPADIPMNQHGVQVFKPDQFTEHDLAGEALHIDPVAAKYRDALSSTLSPEQIARLKEIPDYQEGDGSQAHRMQNAVDSAMRGYLVGQWPLAEVKAFFNPEQLQLLDELKSYMQTGKESSAVREGQIFSRAKQERAQ